MEERYRIECWKGRARWRIEVHNGKVKKEECKEDGWNGIKEDCDGGKI